MKTAFSRSPGYFLWAPDNLNFFSITLEGSSNRESTVSPYHRLPNHIFFSPFPPSCYKSLSFPSSVNKTKGASARRVSSQSNKFEPQVIQSFFPQFPPSCWKSLSFGSSPKKTERGSAGEGWVPMSLSNGKEENTWNMDRFLFGVEIHFFWQNLKSRFQINWSPDFRGEWNHS